MYLLFGSPQILQWPSLCPLDRGGSQTQEPSGFPGTIQEELAEAGGEPTSLHSLSVFPARHNKCLDLARAMKMGRNDQVQCSSKWEESSSPTSPPPGTDVDSKQGQGFPGKCSVSCDMCSVSCDTCSVSCDT